MARSAVLSIDIVADASDATKAFDDAGRAASTAADKIDTVGGRAGDTATGLGALSGALEAAGFGPAADALNLVAVGMDAAEGSTILFKVAQESLSLTTIKDTAARIANTIATNAANVATKIWAATQWLLNAAMTANPVGLLVAGIILLIGVVVLIATKTTWFQDLWRVAWAAIKASAAAVWDWLQGAAEFALGAILAPIKAVQKAFDKVVDAIKSVIEWLKNIKLPKVLEDIGGAIGGIFGGGKSVAGASSSAPALSSRAMTRATSSSGGPVVVNINGALDPVAVARQVRTLLRADDRRRSGVVIA